MICSMTAPPEPIRIELIEILKTRLDPSAPLLHRLRAPGLVKRSQVAPTRAADPDYASCGERLYAQRPSRPPQQQALSAALRALL